jgi:VWFA-related protein
MRLGKLTLFSCAAILTVPMLGAGQQPSPATPTIKVYSRETIVDVLVTDAKGTPVRGLRQSDFTVEENGKPQAIHSFAEFDEDPAPPPEPAPELGPNEFTNNQPLPETGPVNILLLDTLNTQQPADVVHEQEAVMDYLEKMRPGTQIAIFLLSSSGLHTLQPFTCEPSLLRRAVQTHMFEFGTEIEKWTRDWYTVDAIDEIAAYVSRIKGRKNLLWFTPGMPIPLVRDGGYSWSDPTVNGGWTSPDLGVVYRLMDAYELLTTEQIAVYPVDPRGVGDLGMATMRAEEVAEDLGGVAYYNNNDLGSVVASAIDHGSHFYTLSYFPPQKKDDGHFHTIRVAVDLPGLRLVYRKGYNAELPQLRLPTSGPSLMKASLEAKLPNATQLLFDVQVEPGTRPVGPPAPPVQGSLAHKYRNAPLTRFGLLYTLEANQLAFADGPGGTHNGSLEFDIAAYNNHRKLVTTLKQTTKLPLDADQDPQYLDQPFQFSQQLDLPPGSIYLRVGILDRTSNKVGTLEIPLTVPRNGAARRGLVIEKPSEN